MLLNFRMEWNLFWFTVMTRRQLCLHTSLTWSQVQASFFLWYYMLFWVLKGQVNIYFRKSFFLGLLISDKPNFVRTGFEYMLVIDETTSFGLNFQFWYYVIVGVYQSIRIYLNNVFWSCRNYRDDVKTAQGCKKSQRG